MKEYKIIHHTRRSTMEEAINDASADGFQIIDGVRFFTDSEDYYFTATMERESDSDETDIVTIRRQ